MFMFTSNIYKFLSAPIKITKKKYKIHGYLRRHIKIILSYRRKKYHQTKPFSCVLNGIFKIIKKL